MAANQASVADHARDPGIPTRGAEVFANVDLIQAPAMQAGVAEAHSIPIFTQADLRPPFARPRHRYDPRVMRYAVSGCEEALDEEAACNRLRRVALED